MNISVPSLKFKNIPIQHCHREYLHDEGITAHVINTYIHKDKLRVKLVEEFKGKVITNNCTLLNVDIEIKITAKGVNKCRETKKVLTKP